MDLAIRSRGDVHIVGDEDEGGAVLPKFVDQLEDVLAGLAVEIAGQFISKEDRRFSGEGAGEGDPLLLATRELDGIVVSPLTESDFLKQLSGPFLRLFLAAQFEREEDVLVRGLIGKKLERLKDEAELASPDASQFVFGKVVDRLAFQQDLA